MLKNSNYKLSPHYILLVLLFFVAIMLRVFLSYNNWPYMNSDEGTMGLMARHILLKGEHPLLFYGQDYMGVLEAYLGAFFFALLGSSVFALRLGLVVIYAAFVCFMYTWMRQLYKKNFALFIVALFSFGSTAMLSRQLAAIGGYVEADLFAAMSFTFALWLALKPVEGHRQHRLMRHLFFFLWSMVTALGVWSHTAYLPWMVCTFLLLLFCWRELLFKGAIFSLLAGLFFGGIPLIIYNVTAKPGRDTISVLLSFVGKAPQTAQVLYAQIKGTFSISLPIITGDPTCHKSEMSFLNFWGFEQDWSSHCTLLGSVWSAGFLILFILSAGIGLYYLGKTLSIWRQQRELTYVQRQSLIQQCAHLILLFGITSIVIPYLRSMPALNTPGLSARYLMGTWVGLPAVIRPLWLGATSIKVYSSRLLKVIQAGKLAFCISSLALALSIMIYGSSLSLVQVPLARAAEKTEMSNIQLLLNHGVTHAYADYWFSYRTMFYSNEQIICASNVYNYHNNHILLPSENRYTAYYDEVAHDPYAAYIVPTTPAVTIYLTPQDLHAMGIYVEGLLKKQHLKYREFPIQGYMVYQPIKP